MLKPSLQLKLSQQLTMTPQLQQAIRLLQLPVMELQTQIQTALDENVMLEVEEPETSAEDGQTESATSESDDPEEFAALCSKTPAIHRFPGSMAKRIQTLAQIVVDQYGGEASALWTAGDPDGAEVLRRLKGLPGFGEQKAKIFLALLGKQYGVTPKGWREAAGDYGKAGSFMSVADVKDAGSLEKVRSYKKKAKAAAKAAKA